MYSEGEACKEQAETDAVDQVDEDPFHGGGVDVEQNHEANANGGNEPASPERPAVDPDFGHDDPTSDGRGDHGKGLRECGNAGHNGGEIFDGFIVEREEIENGPELMR